MIPTRIFKYCMLDRVISSAIRKFVCHVQDFLFAATRVRLIEALFYYK